MKTVRGSAHEDECMAWLVQMSQCPHVLLAAAHLKDFLD